MSRSSRAGGVLGVGLAMLGVAACSSQASQPPALGDTSGSSSGTASGGLNSPLTSIPTGATSYTLTVGGTVPVAPGVQVGYALTAPSAKSYTFRWTGDASVASDGFQNFYGSIWTTGHFTSLTPGCTNQICPLETNDYVSAVEEVSGGGERIDWNTNASTGWDGFSFTTDTEPVYFDVFIDGNRHPELLVFRDASSGQTNSPADSPFGMSSSN